MLSARLTNIEKYRAVGKEQNKGQQLLVGLFEQLQPLEDVDLCLGFIKNLMHYVVRNNVDSVFLDLRLSYIILAYKLVILVDENKRANSI